MNRNFGWGIVLGAGAMFTALMLLGCSLVTWERMRCSDEARIVLAGKTYEVVAGTSWAEYPNRACAARVWEGGNTVKFVIFEAQK